MKRKTGKVSKSVKKYVDKKLDEAIEDKQLVTTFSTTNIDNIPNFVLLNGLATGNTQGSRISNRIRMKYLTIRYSVGNVGTAATIGSNQFRFMILLDRQPNGGLPTGATLLKNPGAGSAYLSPLLIDGQKRYRVLYDKNFTLQCHGGSVNVGEEKKILIKIPLKRIPTVYKDISAAVGDINTNTLIFAHMCDTSSGSANPVVFEGQADLRYEDA